MKLSPVLLVGISAQKWKENKWKQPKSRVRKIVNPKSAASSTGAHGNQGEYGDLIVAPWQVEPLVALGYDAAKLNVDESAGNVAPAGRGLVTWAKKWSETDDDGKIVVPYAIQNTVPSNLWKQIHRELDDLTLAMGCLKFVYDPDFSYSVGVHVAGQWSSDGDDGDGCWSFVGVCSGCTNGLWGIQPGWQALRLPNWCLVSGGIHHEFLHAIGYLHEQDRPDFWDHFEHRDDAGEITNEQWIKTGHPLEPASNVMYGGFNLLNGKSYSPHPFLTTTDAEQGYALYCEGKENTLPLEPRSKCLEPDEVGVIRPVFEHRLCDGFKDCHDGEDEDGRLATCSEGEKTALGCCKSFFSTWQDQTCTATGEIYNGKDVYICDGDMLWKFYWSTTKGWMVCDWPEYGGCNSVWAWTSPSPDLPCIGDAGELGPGFEWNLNQLDLSCVKGEGPDIPTPCAHHDCNDNERCVNNDDLTGYTCECRDPVNNPCLTTTSSTTTTTTTTTKTSTTTSTTTTTQTEPPTCPPTTACDPECVDGFTCSDGQCVDEDECATGNHYCHSYEECINLLTGKGFKCAPTDKDCDSSLKFAEWKGRNNVKYVYKGEDSVMLTIKFRAKNKFVNPRTELYKGFVFWTKDVCGMDFMKKLRSGEVRVDLVDSTDVYRLGDAYFRDAGKYTHAGFEFELTQLVDKDTPWAFKSGVATKNMGSDDVQVFLTGLKDVQWIDAKGRDWCLLTAANAIVPLEDMIYPDHHIMCLAEAKTFWKAPTDPYAA